MNNFCERFILHYNPHLTSSDLMLLDILSEKYNILDYKNLVLDRNIDSIISRIIIDSIPYKFAHRLIFDNNLFTILVHVDDTIIKPIVTGLSGQDYINKEIERMNTFCKLKLIEDER